MAGRKAFIVKVELDVQAVTCPGVWLCSNGQVSLQIYMLDSCVQTPSFRPSFPMLFHEHFMFSKTLPTKYHLEDLSKQLSREWLYAELIQWENCEVGNVLAYFQIPLNELLYPNIRGVPSGSEVDLLMEVTPAFPGKLAPKLEVSTKTTIEETICTCVPKTSNTCTLSKPKKILSCTGRPRVPRAVCHSYNNKQHRNKKCRPTCLMRCKVYDKPPFRYRKVDDGFLQRQRVLDLPIRPTPQLEVDGGIDGGPYGGPRSTQPDRGMEIRRVLKESLRKALGHSVQTRPCQRGGDCLCECGHAHADAACTVCQKYSGIFNDQMNSQTKKQVFYSTVNPDKALYDQFMNQTHENHETQRALFQKSQKQYTQCKAHSGPSFCRMVHEIPETKSTLSKKLHERISRTLQSIPKYLEDMKEMCSDIGDGESPRGPCTCEQMPDMRKFYKELFQEEYKE